MNVIRYIILICCAALDIGLFFFGVIGLITFAGDPRPSVPAAMVVSWTLGALVLAGLTIWSFYRTVKKKKMPVLYGFFWKIVTVMLVLSATWFSLEIPEAGWLALGLGAVFGAMTFFLPKFWGSTQALGASGSQAGHAGPAQFGGTGTPRIRMTAAAAQRKEEIDEMIEALFMLKMADKYDYKIVYDGSEPNYIFIYATKGDVRTFADSIRLK